MNETEYLDQIEKVIKAGKYKDNWASLCGHPTPSWFSKAKFGIFIHWGIFSVPAFSSEWYSRNMYRKGSPEYLHHQKVYGGVKEFGYKDFIPLFKAEKFNPDEWLDLFEAAGARYVVPVAEHHDGFQMYDSDLSRWNSVRMGPHRDVIGELKRAAEKRKMTFCVSSHRAEHYWFMNGGRELDCDVNDPEYDDFYGPAVLTEGLKAVVPEGLYDVTIDSPKMKEHLDNWLARTCELIDKYHPLMVYFDWWIQNAAFRPYLKKFAAYYYNRAEEWGKEVTIDYKHNAFAYTSATFEIERGQLKDISPRPWQNDTAIAKNSWCYTENNEYKTASDIIGNLVDVVSKNGCMLLNVGPKADGTIGPEDTKVLTDIGTWMKINGEGIYDSTFWKVYGEGPTEIPEGQFSDTSRESFTSRDVRYTFKAGKLYAYIMKMPEDGIVHLQSLRYHDVPAENETFGKPVLLGQEDMPLAANRNDKELTVRVPEVHLSDYPVCIRFDIE